MGKSNKQLVIFKETNRQTSLSQAKKKRGNQAQQEGVRALGHRGDQLQGTPRAAPNSMDGEIKGTGRLLGNQVQTKMKLNRENLSSK